MSGPHGEGRHTTLDKDTKRSVDWLHLQAGVKRIILGPIDVCKHSFAPGTLRVKRTMPGGLELKAYFGVGIRPLYCYLTPGMDTHIMGKIQDRFYPRVRFTAPKMAAAFSEESASLRDADFDRGLQRVWAEEAKAQAAHQPGPLSTPEKVVPEAPPEREPHALPSPPIPVVAKVVAGEVMDNNAERTLSGSKAGKPANQPKTDYYTIDQAAKKLGVSVSHVRTLMHTKKITGQVKVGAGPSGFTMIPAAALTGLSRAERAAAKAAEQPAQRVNGSNGSNGTAGLATLHATIKTLNTRIERLSTLLDMVLDSQTAPAAHLSSPSAATSADEGLRG